MVWLSLFAISFGLILAVPSIVARIDGAPPSPTEPNAAIGIFLVAAGIAGLLFGLFPIRNLIVAIAAAAIGLAAAVLQVEFVDPPPSPSPPPPTTADSQAQVTSDQ